MTTLVSLVTKDSVVLGCDSLGTVTRALVEPKELWRDFFHFDFEDKENFGKLKLDQTGQPILKTINDVYNKSRIHPYYHITHMEKLFSLEPLKIGVMTAGIAGLGNRTIKSLISEFKDKNFLFQDKSESNNYTLDGVAGHLLEFIKPFYLAEHPETNNTYRPGLEFILAGYSQQEQLPSSIKINFPEGETEPFSDEFGIMFGGQTKEIQRIIDGTDSDNMDSIIIRYAYKIFEYHKLLTEYLQEKDIDIDLPDPNSYSEQLNLFSGNWRLEGFSADWGNFSEQNAIDCVHWLVEIMCKAQQFSSALPTVGGEINIAIVTKSNGFRFVSRREYRVGDYSIPREEGKEGK